MVDISVIIVSWNAKELLYECLLSLLRKTSHYKVEIIVVDNASTDGAPELVEEKFPHVKLIRNDENLGFSKANNIGIKESTGRYVCLINSDAIALKDCLDRMCKYMDEQQEIGVLGPKLFNPDGTLQPNCREFPTLWNSFCRALALDTLFPKAKLFSGQLMTFWAHDSVRTVDFISGAFIMVRKNAIDQVGVLDEDFFFYGEDKDWCMRFWKEGWKVVFFPEAEAIHYLSGSTKETVEFYIRLTKADLQFYRKHYRKIVRLGLLIISFLHPIVRIMGLAVLFFIRPSEKKEAVNDINKNLSSIKWLLGISKGL